MARTFANKGVLWICKLICRTPRRVSSRPTSPPIITDKTIVIAGSVADNFSTRETSGVIRGCDVNTGGKLLCGRFDRGERSNAIPADEHAFTQQLSRRTHRAPAAYMMRKLDLVYLPMGVTTPDIWGGNRTPGQERYASSILALNIPPGAGTGYQTVHHDLWDMDLPARPTLADITVDGPLPFRLSMRQRKPVISLCSTDVMAGWSCCSGKTGPAERAAKGDYVKTQRISDLTFRPKRSPARGYVGARDHVRPTGVPALCSTSCAMKVSSPAVRAGDIGIPQQRDV